MKKQAVEQIAVIVEQLLKMSGRRTRINRNRISFVPVDVNQDDPHTLTDIATRLANDAIAKGLCSLASLKKSLQGARHIPTDGYQVERGSLIIGCMIYHREKQCHLILFGKE